MKILFLDDNLERTKLARRGLFKHQTTCVTTARECIGYLEEDNFKVLFLDHDLGDEVYQNSSCSNCGMEVVRWIDKNRPDIELIIVHSMNEPAAKLMLETLKSAGYHTCHMPFGTFKFETLLKED